MLKNNVTKILFISGTLILLTQSAQAYGGDWRWHPRRHDYHERHHYPRRGEIAFNLPFSFVRINLGSARYYYCDGVYYRRHRNEYIVIDPPPGVIIDALPAEYAIEIIDGVTYYKCDGVYYRSIGHGYQVAAPPTSTTVIETASLAPAVSKQNVDETFTVNIPNSRGGYNAVNLKKSGDGFIGPQGEFFREFPRVEQLKVMYGK